MQNLDCVKLGTVGRKQWGGGRGKESMMGQIGFICMNENRIMKLAKIV
jgi:hypothetical protein